MKGDSEHCILVVEDSPEDSDLIQDAFEGSRFRKNLVVVPDGEAALEHLYGENGRRPGRLPVLILLDMGLPRMSGQQVLQRIRARMKHVPVVVFTSDERENERHLALEAGANLYIVKPQDARSFRKFARWIEGLLEFLD